MGDPNKSYELFNKALELKRQGRYEDALIYYRKSVDVYPEDPQIAEAFNAMGKVLYLMGCYGCSRVCYCIYASFLKLFRKDQFEQKYNIIAWHMGHACVDENPMVREKFGKYVLSYKMSITDQKVDVDFDRETVEFYMQQGAKCMEENMQSSDGINNLMNYIMLTPIEKLD